MLKKVAACLILFLIVVGSHAAWISSRPGCAGDCSECCGPPEPVGLKGYMDGQDYFLGLSYGLSGAFALYALWIFFERRRAAAVAGAAGGLTLAGFISAVCCGGGCFAAGCCGSPTLPILASLLGGTVFRFMKPLAFGITLLSIGFGLWWLARKNRMAAPSCNCGDGCCGG
jgi:hypothetical protein